jgi:hypothetical protein
LTPTLQLEETPKATAAIPREPKFLVEWTSRWDEFRSSIGPAFARSEARLAGEAPYGIVPFRSGIPTMIMEAFLVFAVIVVRVKIEQMRPYVAPRLSSRDVVYYTGDELPRTADLGGSQSGTAGRAGGSEAHHRTQTIKVARGSSLTARVVDAPDLKLPSSHDAVANLLAVRPNAGPPPSEGLRSNRTSVRVPTSIIAPSPDVIRDYTRNGVRLDTVILPAPSASRAPFQTAPNLSATVIPPAPSVSNDRTLVAPALAPTVVAPAPRVTRDRALASHSLDPNVVAPAPSVTADKTRSAPAMTTNVIAPAPSAVSRQITSAPVQVTTDVVPPPVSAPERATGRESKLNMPAPSVVAPPPSADLSQDMRHVAGGSVPDTAKTVVPPPPTQSGSGSLMSAIVGKIFGASEVVPPPPNVNANANGGSKSASLPTNVVAPPPSVAANSGGTPRGNRNGTGPALGSNVIAPPPSAGLAGGTGTRPLSASAAPTIGPGSVVPPPPSLAGPGGGTGETGGGKGAPGGTLLANNVVPPPPSVGTGANSSGSGMGRSGPGLGTAMDVGAPSTTPTNGGSGNNAGVVISSDAGSKVGLPTNGGKGSTAMSPTGGDKPGLGGTGSGTSIARGNGSGSSLNGEGPGAGKSGTGHGFDPNARSGISTSAGPGGAGNAASGTPAVAGASIEGGTSVVTLPSFGTDAGASEPSAPGHSSAGKQPSKLDVVVVATATSGGAFEPYKSLLHGQQYTTYLDTSVGTVVMEFAEEAAARSRDPLASPQPIRTDLADGFPRGRIVLACTLDASGNLRNIRMLEPVPAGVAAKIMSALRAWKFQPAAHGDEAVPVTAILGFGIDTNDRF